MDKWILKGPDSKRVLWLPSNIELSEEAEADIQSACRIAYRRADAELSGIGHVQDRQDGSFFITDIVVPRQTCGESHTTIFGEVMQTAFDELRDQGRNPLEYNFWWHSHVKGKAWFSSIDDDMIALQLKVMLNIVHYLLTTEGRALPDETFAGPFISLVGNVQGDMTARCDFLYRRGGKFTQIMCVIPVVRHVGQFSEEKHTALVDARTARMIPIVREKVSFRERISDFLRPKSFNIHEDGDDK